MVSKLCLQLLEVHVAMLVHFFLIYMVLLIDVKKKWNSVATWTNRILFCWSTIPHNIFITRTWMQYSIFLLQSFMTLATSRGYVPSTSLKSSKTLLWQKLGLLVTDGFGTPPLEPISSYSLNKTPYTDYNHSFLCDCLSCSYI